LINGGGIISVLFFITFFFVSSVVGNGKSKVPFLGFSECEVDDEEEFDSDGGDDERRARVVI
jgi:hypothetical protein